MKDRFYITTAIPYVNANPHIGHALEFAQTDAVARYQKLLGKEVCVLSGSDENALKNVQAAEKAGKELRRFIDDNAREFERLAKELHVHFDIFQKGSDQKTHFTASQELWKRCEKAGDIYKKEYQGLYCVGCEAFYTPEELNEKGECFEHPGKKLEMVSESNYFFRLSKYQQQLIELVKNDVLKVYPEFRKNEVLGFLEKPLLDISVSRSNDRARNWGVPVPGDDSQRMYVWFDALNIYQSGIGFGWNDELYGKWWPASVHAIGKGIIRFHAVYWPAFLLSAGLALPKSLMVHGYITVDGQKMSKTIGNVIDPFDMINEYGAEAVRYYLLREIPTYSDGDYAPARMKELYNAELANELGNLVSRITTIAEKDGLTVENSQPAAIYTDAMTAAFSDLQLDHVLKLIWEDVRALNKKTNDFAPWKKTAPERSAFLTELLREISLTGYRLTPFMPETATRITEATTGQIKKSVPLFPRLKTL